MIPENTRIRVRNFKSFGSSGLLIDGFKPINVVIGRNNSGKSALLDVIEHLCANSDVDPVHHHKGTASVFSTFCKFPEGALRQQFNESTSGGWIGGNHWHSAGAHLVNEEAEFSVLSGKNPIEVISYEPSTAAKAIKNNRGLLVDSKKFSSVLGGIAQSVKNPLGGYRTIRLSAERDVSPEARLSEIKLRANGAGLTNMIAQVVTSTKYDSRIVEQRMLQTINEILYPDIHIDGIRVQEHDNQSWEIFLEQSSKGSISLSNSGSGLKTVLLTVAALQGLSELNKGNLSRHIFLLEELENNLHPAMQRRLLAFVDKFINDNDAMAFVTTHSGAVIDMFSRSENAQIIHVVADGEDSAHALVANTHISRMGIMDDLDIRASDVLQSNGVVWVEGPSDRIYFNRWMELISEGKLVEGVHYQCVFYGGRLLSHLTGDPDSSTGGVQILRVARNAMILMDSDRASRDDEINDTKKRLASEIQGVGGLVWISDGREIENYLTPGVFARLDPRLSGGIGRYDEIEAFLSGNLESSEARRLIRSKSAFSEIAAALVQRDDIILGSPLEQMLLAARAEIAKWNGMASQFS